jgi:alkaline phosphatase D
VAWPVTGLAAGTRHRAEIAADGRSAGSFAFTTAPADDDARAVRIAWSGDLDLDPEFASPILDAAVATDPDLFVMLGDWPYADNAPGAITLAEYRERHREARADAGTQRWMRTVSFRAMYDDHEIRNDWDLGSWARETERHVGAMRAWDEHFPVRAAASDVRYRSWRWGAHVEAWLLDNRRHRAPLEMPDGPQKTMLGDAQRQWLIDGVLASTATFKLVFTTVPLDYGWTTEHWNAYAWERAALLDALAGGDVRGLVFLCADSHWFASHRCLRGAREFQAGPLARGLPDLPAPGAGELAQVRAYNLGLLDIDTTGTLTIRCIDSAGATRFSESLTPDQLALT